MLRCCVGSSVSDTERDREVVSGAETSKIMTQSCMDLWEEHSVSRIMEEKTCLVC